MAGKYLKIYFDMIPAIEALSDTEAGRLIKGALKYSSIGESPAFSGSERFTWPSFMGRIDEDIAHSSEVSQKRRASGALSHSKRNQLVPNASNCYQMLPKKEEERDEERTKERSKEKKREAESEDRKSSRRYAPPTREEVRAYAAERNSSVDPDQFYDYFSTGEWLDIKGNLVKNWKQKFIVWEGKGYGQRINPDHAPKRSEEWNVHYD